MVNFVSKGDWKKSLNFLEKLRTLRLDRILNETGRKGVDALIAHTPVDTGLAASSWRFETEYGEGYATVTFHNMDIEGGYNVAILVQYGHGTGTGGYVQGRDFINPALRPVFDEMANQVWEEVRKL